MCTAWLAFPTLLEATSCSLTSIVVVTITTSLVLRRPQAFFGTGQAGSATSLTFLLPSLGKHSKKRPL